MKLRDLQQRFVASLVLPSVDPLLLNTINKNESKLKDLNISSEDFQIKRFNCYRNNFRYGLIKALSSIYPVIKALVGESFFQFLSSRYTQVEVPVHYNLQNYGEEFSGFLNSISEIHSLSYLEDVAKLEWIIHGVLGQLEDHSYFNYGSLTSIDENAHPNIVFKLRENSVLFSSRFPVHKIWEANQKNNKIEDIIDLNMGDAKLLIFKKDDNLYLDELNEFEFNFLTKIQQECSFQEFHDFFMTKEDKMDEHMNRTLFNNMTEIIPKFIQRGYITGFYLKSPG